jgi:hypothetical protein
MRMTFGKHKGKDLADIPDDYLLWCLENCERLNPILRDAIERRLGIETGGEGGISPHDVEGLVRRCFRQLALRFHPDRGGNTDKMAALNEALETLLAAMRQEWGAGA